MEAKRFRANTIKGATARVKSALGADAMILSTRKLSGRGEHNFFEVTAVPSGGISNGDSNGFGEVKSELMSIKEMIYLLNHSEGIIEKLMTNTALLNLYSKLIRNGVNQYYAKAFFQKAGAFNMDPETSHRNNISRKIINVIGQAIRVKDTLAVKEDHRTVAAFVGTTGVGKTTTIAKLAALIMLKARRTVGLISLDSYRIGGIEQLKTYANILGVPCFPAFNKRDLLFALRSMERADFVLIDTSGQSQYDMSRLGELKKMLIGDIEISPHLLLSVTTTESEMNKTAINFSPLKFRSYIFTKTDEAEKCGRVINQLMKQRMPVSYITTGQNVPADIEKATKENILKLLLKKN